MTLPTLTMSENSVSRRRLAFLCVGIAGLIFVALGFWAAKQGLLSLSGGAPQTYSELYFTNDRQLPKQLDSGKQYQLSFAIANHEGHTKAYQYQVTLTQDGQTTKQAVQRLEVKNDQRSLGLVFFKPSDVAQPVAASVTLLESGQTINYEMGR
jgi:hypothetical protein